MCEITVLMLVWNGEKYIRESIDSVLNQSFGDFEFLIMDDGSTDRTIDIIKSYHDSRIRLEERGHDYIANLNEGLSLAKGDYIARMDSDDIMHSERLRIQLKRMKQNPDIAVCGTWAKPFKAEGALLPPIQIGEYIVEDPVLEMLKENFIIHPSVMMRKNILEENGLRYQDYYSAEDYKLWFEIAKSGGIFFIEPQILLFYRISDTQMSIVYSDKQSKHRKRIKGEILEYLIHRYSNNAFTELSICMNKIMEMRLISEDETSMLFYNLFNNMKMLG
jgi:glycosyltransferase involved in cell wall biosynthesis